MPANPRIAGTDKPHETDARQWEPLVPGQIGREAVGIVEKIQASFLKSAEAELSELLQSPVAMSSGGAAQASFSKALHDIGPEDRVVALDLTPVRGCGFLAFPPSLLFRVLDILLATPETASAESGLEDTVRVVTGIELHILREFFEAFTRSLRGAWAPFCPVAFKQVPAEEESEMRAAYGEDPALILSANIDLAGISAVLRLVLPAFLARMAQLKSKAPVGRASDSEPVRGNILNCLGGAILRMDAVLDGASIRIRNLLDLAPGQVLMSGNAEGSSFDCLVNKRRQFAGQLVASNGRCAIQVETTHDARSGAPGGQFTGEPAADK